MAQTRPDPPARWLVVLLTFFVALVCSTAGFNEGRADRNSYDYDGGHPSCLALRAATPDEGADSPMSNSQVLALSSRKSWAPPQAYDGCLYDLPVVARVPTITEGALRQVASGADGSASLAAETESTGTALVSLSSTPSAAARFGGHPADDLVRGASAARGDYTAAGHALTKHAAGQRGGSSAFPSLSGNPANINRIAQGQIDDILANGRVVTRTHPNHGPIVEVFAPDGRGARWYADGRFFGFLEP